MATAQTSRDWFDYLTAMTPVIIAIFVAFIAYRQWRVAREKLRLDLYGRRFAVFETTLLFYQDLLNGGNQPADEAEKLHRKYITAMMEAKFLFSKASRVYEMMEDFNKSAFAIKSGRNVTATHGIPPELVIETHDRVFVEQMNLEAKLSQIESSMSPYLSFGRIST